MQEARPAVLDICGKVPSIPASLHATVLMQRRSTSALTKPTYQALIEGGGAYTIRRASVAYFFAAQGRDGSFRTRLFH